MLAASWTKKPTVGEYGMLTQNDKDGSYCVWANDAGLELVNKHRPLMVLLVMGNALRRYRRYAELDGATKDDMLSVGEVGLHAGVGLWNPEKGKITTSITTQVVQVFRSTFGQRLRHSKMLIPFSVMKSPDTDTLSYETLIESDYKPDDRYDEEQDECVKTLLSKTYKIADDFYPGLGDSLKDSIPTYNDVATASTKEVRRRRVIRASLLVCTPELVKDVAALTGEHPDRVHERVISDLPKRLRRLRRL